MIYNEELAKQILAIIVNQAEPDMNPASVAVCVYGSDYEHTQYADVRAQIYYLVDQEYLAVSWVNGETQEAAAIRPTFEGYKKLNGSGAVDAGVW
jgi:hypothetical protein